MDSPNPFLPVHGLARGETISSMMDRAGAIYGVDGVVFGRMFLCRAAAMRRISVPTVNDWDDPPEIVKRILAECLKISVSDLDEHSIHDGPRWLAPGSRSAWCPYCFAQDLHFRSGWPYFRREWALISRTFCYEHSCPEPLLSWPDPKPDKRYFDGGRNLPVEVVTDRIMSLSTREYLRRRQSHSDAYRSLISKPSREIESKDPIEWLQEWEQRFDSKLEFFAALLNNEQLDEKKARYYTREELDEIRRTEAIPGCEITTLQKLLSSLSFQAGRLYLSHERWYWNFFTWAKPDLSISYHLEHKNSDEVSALEKLRHCRDPSERRAQFWLAACTYDSAGWLGLRDLCQVRPVFVPYGLSPSEKKMT